MTQSGESTISSTKYDRLTVLLAEYDAIEKMHIHYDVVNMSLTAVITAGILTIWGLVLSSAFQTNGTSTNIDSLNFIISISILALLVASVLAVWIRYITIHRCIVIQKLHRSHEIESELGMCQNSIFIYDSARFEPKVSGDRKPKRRPGGHTLELLLYWFLSTFGLCIAVFFHINIFGKWTIGSVLLLVLLFTAFVGSILWMTFCKKESAEIISDEKHDKVVVGLPWNILFVIVEPVNSLLRKLANWKTKEVKREN